MLPVTTTRKGLFVTEPEAATGARRQFKSGAQVHSQRLNDSSAQPASLAPVVRTCVGCRQRDAQAHLVRVVECDGMLVVDPRGNQPGRGAYLHRNPECVAQATRRKPWARALKVPGPLVDTHLWEALNEVPHPKGERP
jgi:hypothetical protein